MNRADIYKLYLHFEALDRYSEALQAIADSSMEAAIYALPQRVRGCLKEDVLADALRTAAARLIDDKITETKKQIIDLGGEVP
jgi:hypothetical protein